MESKTRKSLTPYWTVYLKSGSYLFWTLREAKAKAALEPGSELVKAMSLRDRNGR